MSDINSIHEQIKQYRNQYSGNEGKIETDSRRFLFLRDKFSMRHLDSVMDSITQRNIPHNAPLQDHGISHRIWSNNSHDLFTDHDGIMRDQFDTFMMHAKITFLYSGH